MEIKGIPIEESVRTCRFGCEDPAVGEYDMSNGCACYPNDRTQILCVQHAISAEPLGTMMLTRIFSIERLRVLNPESFEE